MVPSLHSAGKPWADVWALEQIGKHQIPVDLISSAPWNQHTPELTQLLPAFIQLNCLRIASKVDPEWERRVLSCNQMRSSQGSVCVYRCSFPSGGASQVSNVHKSHSSSFPVQEAKAQRDEASCQRSHSKRRLILYSLLQIQGFPEERIWITPGNRFPVSKRKHSMRRL